MRYYFQLLLASRVFPGVYWWQSQVPALDALYPANLEKAALDARRALGFAWWELPFCQLYFLQDIPFHWAKEFDKML